MASFLRPRCRVQRKLATQCDYAVPTRDRGVLGIVLQWLRGANASRAATFTGFEFPVTVLIRNPVRG